MENVLGIIGRNANEQLRLQIKVYQDRLFFDARIFFKTPEGESLPTKKGISVGVDDFPAFQELVAKAATYLKPKCSFRRNRKRS